jgi:prepilin peptidase CpaA
MTIGTPEIILLGLLAILLLFGAVTDWQRRSIDNWLTGTIALAAPLYWWATGLGWWPDIALQLGIASIVLAIGIGLFAVGAMGGGDVKLLGGLALWFPGLVMLRLSIIMSIVGGILTLLMLVRHKISKSETPLEVPYGIAISLAGLWVIYERNLNQFG